MIFFFILAIAIALGGVLSMFATFEGRRLTAVGIGCLVLAVLLGILSMVRIVPANTVALPVTFGKAGEPVGPGLRLTSPFTNIRGFSTRVQTSSRLAEVGEGDKDKVDCVQAAASDGAVLCIDATLRYTVNPQRVRDLFKRYGSFDRVRDVLVRRETEEALKDVYGSYTPEQAVSGETAGELSDKAKAALDLRFDKFGLRMDSITIGRVHVDAKVQQRIDAKIQARQDGERALIEQAKAVTLAQTKQKQAEIAAKEAVAKATGQADAARIQAQGEADANRTIAASLTPQLLQRLYYEALSGAKQLIITGNGAAPTVLVGQ